MPSFISLKAVFPRPLELSKYSHLLFISPASNLLFCGGQGTSGEGWECQASIHGVTNATVLYY